MNEASKTRRLWDAERLALLEGNGIDIGCGPDPIAPSVRKFDLEDGDANEIAQYVSERFDFVFSAHCLEHMRDPRRALVGWWQLVREGGHLIVVVPDEDLYEQGYWPSLFNSDHKSSFTIAKRESWSPRSFNLADLLNDLPDADLVSIELQTANYNRRLQQSTFYPRGLAWTGAAVIALATKVSNRLGGARFVNAAARILRFPIDQTQGQAVAQIQAIVRKKTPVAA